MEETVGLHSGSCGIVEEDLALRMIGDVGEVLMERDCA
jgi:hypothetical protein